ncbi:cathepsin G-like [Planococcus citri]|uniref:cathepsin G-like n=1 Tax=Planococcus citri TaxID=170843 RepID=UPI0031F91DF5
MVQARKIIAIICVVLLFIIIVITMGIILFIEWVDYRSYEVARKQCYDYVQFACDHPVTNNTTNSPLSPIMGGKDALEGAFPHMACLEMAEETTANRCGATLISAKFVLTAAHCVSRYNTTRVTVKLGSVYCASGKIHGVKKMIIHRSFDSKTAANDIALLELDVKVDFSPYIRPICLSTIIDYGVKNLFVSGWGRDENNKLSDRLQVVETYVDERVLATCVNQFGFETHPTKICAAHPTQRKSACQGDSGGPLQSLMDDQLCPNVYKQIGIVSHDANVNCTVKANQPHVVAYTKVRPYVPWIVKNVWPELLPNTLGLLT